MNSASHPPPDPVPAQQFTDEEIATASRLRDLGLAWQPTVGHYVYDEGGAITPGSPFQDRVYFILSMKHYLNRLESIDTMREALLWLPTWRQARQILHDFGLSNEQVARHLQAARAIESGTELLTLYEMIADTLQTG